MNCHNALKAKNAFTGLKDGMKRGNYLMSQIRASTITMNNSECELLAILKYNKVEYEGVTPDYLFFIYFKRI